MKIERAAVAGTLESSDAQITVEPGTEGIELTIESSVIWKADQGGGSGNPGTAGGDKRPRDGSR